MLHIPQGRYPFPDSEAYNAAANWVAVPGTSEHQTGLALDIVTVENQMLDNSQLKSECQLWMMEHCYDYGSEGNHMHVCQSDDHSLN